MAVGGKGEGYYTASEVAKIKGITRQSVIDGCKRGQYPGAHKTEPDGINTQGVWLIPKISINAAVMTQDIIKINQELTPQEVQALFRATWQEEREKLRQEILDEIKQETSKILESIEILGSRLERNRRPWWKIW